MAQKKQMTLTDAAYVTRRTVRLSAIGAAVLFCLWLVWKGGVALWEKIHPTPPPPPTVGFGLLPHLPFPQQPGKPQITLQLETPTGGLPTFPSEAKVYFMPKPGSDFLDLDTAKKRAAALGFIGDPTKRSDQEYQWTSPGGYTFVINIVTDEFSYQYDYTTDQSLLRPQNLMGPDDSARAAKAFLSQVMTLPDDLVNGTVKDSYFRFTGSQLSPVLSLSDADFVRVNLFRENYDGLPVLPLDPQKGQVWLLMSGSQDRYKQFVQAEYHSFPVDPQRTETYPLVPVEKAWEAVQVGNYYLAELDDQHGSTITVRRVYLGYFDPQRPIGYMEPIYIFEGDSNFIGYVPAVDPSWFSRQ